MPARPVHKGSTYHLTKRCVLRQYLTSPNEFVTQVLEYCIAVAAERYGVEVHAACVMSNHQHQVVTDRWGMIPEYMHWVDAQSAQCLNVHYGRRGPVWENQQYRRVTLNGESGIDGVGDPLESDDDILEKIVYTVTNPVSAGLVAKSEQWPGACHGPVEGTAQTVRIERPKLYFRSTPEEAELRIVRPPCYQELSDHELRQLVKARVEERERTKRDEFRAQGRTILGAKRVLKIRPTDSPSTPVSAEKKRPEIAGKDRKRRKERQEQLIAWLDAYRKALEAFQSGDRNVEFPPGTYYMRKRFGVRVAKSIEIPLPPKPEPKPPD